MPEQLGDNEIVSAIEVAISQTGAGSVKDMGKVMAYLKQEYAGKMDFSKISARVKTALMDLSKAG